MECRFIRTAENAVQTSSVVSLGDLSFGIHGLIVCDGGNEGTGISGIRGMRVYEEAVRLFRKTHDGAVEAVNVEGTRRRGVHGHAPNLHDLGERENVGD